MSNLNLARKWRPQNFEGIIGQELSINMLKNSLFLKKLFPVYLFSGQRGCGKTSTARVFAAAINCEKLSSFQKDAKKQVVPCLECDSCKSMLKSRHPDFIEMDAASHTGVDSVRQIIESSSYMPLSGSKKIYLIDEAHMLSKAAFNAFPKILEEPPPAVIFILATTNMEKIPETVKSRCFQVLFNPVTKVTMSKHIEEICAKESINADKEAIALLIEETDGSVRDTINTLEQVRFTGENITKELVLKTLGKITEEEFNKILIHIANQNTQALLEQLKSMNFETLSAKSIWNMLAQSLRTLLWILHGASSSHSESLEKIANHQFTKNKINALMQIMWSQEDIFLRTPNKHMFLEMVLVQMCSQVNIAELDELISFCRTNASNGGQRQVHQDSSGHKTTLTPTTPKLEATTIAQPKTDSVPIKNDPDNWKSFLSSLSALNDPMLTSIFQQSLFIRESGQTITLQPQSGNPFIMDKLNESESKWKPLLIANFPNFVKFEFESAKKKSPKIEQPTVKSENPIKLPPRPSQPSNQQTWKQSNSVFSKNVMNHRSVQVQQEPQ